MAEKINSEANMTVDEALQYADDRTTGATFHDGQRDIEMVLAILAFEVRRLRKLLPVGKEKDDELGVLADAAKASANRISDAIDETLTFVEASNKRINAMEHKAAKKKSDSPRIE